MELLRILLKRFRRWHAPANADEAFRIAIKRLRAGDIAVDCGANVGLYTQLLADTGATVHAFEPDPVAFEVLATRLAGYSNVHLHQVAVSNREGTARLYLHESRSIDPVMASVGSSLVASKTNINPDTFVEVPIVRFAERIAALGHVRILKMDIEGHEIEVLNDLLDCGCMAQIERTFVELHDRKNPQLATSTQSLRERLGKTNHMVDLTWH